MNYTTLKQSKEIIKSGLRPSTADMCYFQDILEGCECILWRRGWSKYPILVDDDEYDTHLPEPINLPCWSAGALILS